MNAFPADADTLAWLRIATMSFETFSRLVNMKFKNANKRTLNGLLKQFVMIEEEAQTGTASPSHWERVTYIRARLSRAFGREAFEAKYARLRKRLEQKQQREQRLIDEAKREVRVIYQDEHPFVRICQEPVGHGGFHQGILRSSPYHSIRWVYDCGSWRRAGRAALRARIKVLAEHCQRDGKTSIDLLFVSHFDADHVYGLRQLLTAVPANTVVIPYLGPVGTFAILCEAADQGRFSQALIDQVMDPVRWFHENGALRVIQLRPGPPPLNGEEPPSIPDLPPPDSSPDVMDGTSSASIVDVKKRPFKAKRIIRNAKTRESVIADPGAVVGINTGTGKWADWWFVPYAHPIPAVVHRQLRREAKRTIGAPVHSRQFMLNLKRILKTKTGIKRIKNAYRRAGMKDANGISLSVYTGPRPSIRGRRKILLDDDTKAPKPAGWILSGDAKLQSADKNIPWIECFGSFKKTTGMLMLPHHGSLHNFDKSILACVPHADLFVTADAADKTRPNRKLRQIVKRQTSKSVRKVSEVRTKGITEVSGPERNTSDQFPARW